MTYQIGDEKLTNRKEIISQLDDYVETQIRDTTQKIIDNKPLVDEVELAKKLEKVTLKEDITVEQVSKPHETKQYKQDKEDIQHFDPNKATIQVITKASDFKGIASGASKEEMKIMKEEAEESKKWYEYIKTTFKLSKAEEKFVGLLQYFAEKFAKFQQRLAEGLEAFSESAKQVTNRFFLHHRLNGK